MNHLHRVLEAATVRHLVATAQLAALVMIPAKTGTFSRVTQAAGASLSAAVPLTTSGTHMTMRSKSTSLFSITGGPNSPTTSLATSGIWGQERIARGETGESTTTTGATSQKRALAMAEGQAGTPPLRTLRVKEGLGEGEMKTHGLLGTIPGRGRPDRAGLMPGEMDMITITEYAIREASEEVPGQMVETRALQVTIRLFITTEIQEASDEVPGQMVET